VSLPRKFKRSITLEMVHSGINEAFSAFWCILRTVLGFHVDRLNIEVAGLKPRGSSPLHHFYRAMHYSAKHGLAIACRLSVCLSVTLVDQDHIGGK